jgi:hypothetical protein
MKKIFALCILASLMAACNNSNPDVQRADSAVRAAADTIKASADTAVRKIDSGIKAIADTATVKIHAVEDGLKKKLKK